MKFENTYDNLSDIEIDKMITEIIEYDIIDEMYNKNYIIKICKGTFHIIYEDNFYNEVFLLIKQKLNLKFEMIDEKKNCLLAKILFYFAKNNDYYASKLPYCLLNFCLKDMLHYIKDNLFNIVYFDKNSYIIDIINNILSDDNKSNDEKIESIKNSMLMNRDDIVINFETVENQSIFEYNEPIFKF